MRKRDIAVRLAQEMEWTDVQGKRVINTVLDIITQELLAGQGIELRGFGIWKIKTRKARKGRNPRAGTTVQIPARRIITWKPGKELKNAIL